MSSIIESVARGAKSSLTGESPAANEKAMDARGMQLIKQLATGGLALGAGTSAAVALVNYLKSLSQESELEDESRLNDDTLYIPEIKKKAATEEGSSVNRWLAPGLAVTGGILSAGGAYALTQAVYNYMQKKRREKMLDKAQGEALNAADIEVQKSAAKMNFYDLVTAFPVAVPLLAALASGGVAYAALQKTFPVVKNPKSKYPKRIRQLSSGGNVEELPGNEEAEILSKAAASARSLRADADCEDSAAEFLLLITDQLAAEKNASISLTSDLINRVAKDGLGGAVSTYRDGGLAALTESLKGASDSPADFGSKSLAAAAICKSARLAPIARTLAAAEFQDLVPGIYGAAVAQGEETMEKLAGVASLFNMTFFRPHILEKSALSREQLMGELSGLIDSPEALDPLQGLPGELEGLDPQQGLPGELEGLDPQQGLPGEMEGLGGLGGLAAPQRQIGDLGMMATPDADGMEDALTSDVGGALSDDAEGGESDSEEENPNQDDDQVRPESDDPVDSFMDMDGKSPMLGG